VPELPDLTVYLEALARRLQDATLGGVRLRSPFLLRSVEPPLASACGRTVLGIRRIGKRLVIGLEGELFLVIHLMIAGRLHWKARGAALAGKPVLAGFDFSTGTLVLTEAGSKRRAALYLVQGEPALSALDPGGVEPLGLSIADFRSALARENRTLKRALTDPHLVAGIGNAYSDEILHAARLSPFQRTANLGEIEWRRLHEATERVLQDWTDRLRREAGENFPAKVTAFRPEMAVHGKFGQPCSSCGSPVQRIVYAENEANYCPTCQTGGKLLADRALSQLLREDWPRTLEELEERRRGSQVPM